MDEDYQVPDDDNTPDVIQEENATSLDDLLFDDCKSEEERVESYDDKIKALAGKMDADMEEIGEEISDTSQKLNQILITAPHDRDAQRGLEQRLSDLQRQRRDIERNAMIDIHLLDKERFIAKEDLERCKRLKKL